MSIQGSEQGSSDDPDKGNHKDDTNSVQQPGRGAGSTYLAGGQGSDGSFSKTKNSGSKRKNTNDSSEPSSRGKRYKERYRKKKAEQDRLADAGFRLVKCMREETDWKMSKDEKIDKCLETKWKMTKD